MHILSNFKSIQLALAVFCCTWLLLVCDQNFCSAQDRIFTLWPLIDYRQSDAADYSSLHLFGPLFKYERKGQEVEYGLRPFFFKAHDQEDHVSFSEYLYPLASRFEERGKRRFQFFRLLEYDFGQEVKGSENEFMLFPFLFYGQHPEKGEYLAFFPIGGKIYGRFWRDEIRFFLFPLYGQTVKKDTVTTNVLWPIYANIRGENERGTKFWPIYGIADKEGSYRKRFVFWPFYFDYHQRLDTDNPVHRKAFFPLYIHENSPSRTQKTWLWPFFSHIVDREKDYEEWNTPWPLIRRAQGEYKESRKFLPVYSYERKGSLERWWYLWPLFLHSRLTTEELIQDKHRVLFFLYSQHEEWKISDPGNEDGEKWMALWPVFTYERRNGVSTLSTLALLRPFFQHNESISRNWSPLWTLYKSKWDRQGNVISTFLWNLYWKERRGNDMAFEIFPLIRYKSQNGVTREVKILKGLVEYSRESREKSLSFLFLPWDISWGSAASGT